MRLFVSSAILLLSVGALAACDSADKGPKTLEEAKQEAKQLERPEPGQYRQTTRFTKFEVPGAPPQMVEQIKTMMSAKGETSTYCLSKADSDKGFEEMFKKVGDGDCKYDRFDATASTIDAILVCNAGPGGSARLAMNGTVSRTGSEVKVDVVQKNDKSPMGNATIAMEISSKRVGECPAGAS
ncbi:MAG TPA: DUF3617 domain-containing protein [Novosphingobium sp.]|nr:DUF3617 domain-containing protein [Novosphingobium sp.]